MARTELRASRRSSFGAGIDNDHDCSVLDGCTVSGHAATGGNGSDAITSGAEAAMPAQPRAPDFTVMEGASRSRTRCSAATKPLAAWAVKSVRTRRGQRRRGGSGGNGGLAAGAAIHNSGSGQLIIWNSLFTSNVVVGGVAGVAGAAGLVVGTAGESGDSGSGVGAGIYNDSGTLAVINSTFLSNSGQGSLGNTGAAGTALYDVQDGFNGGLALGGGIYAGAGTAALTNCTFAANALTGGTGGTGGAGSGTFFGSSGGKGGAAETRWVEAITMRPPRRCRL